MKKLQNNFTTAEQSKRLLELGVPVDSADCIAHIVDNGIELYEDFVLKGDVIISVLKERHTYTKATTLEDGCRWLDEPYPCWSVGRLIEIYLLCAELKKPQMIFIKEDVLMMDRMINELCYMAESERLDLSKLEL